jgi:hypothetical protein
MIIGSLERPKTEYCALEEVILCVFLGIQTLLALHLIIRIAPFA